MSDLFVDNIKHQSSQGSGTITLGTSGETIALASGASVTGNGLVGITEADQWRLTANTNSGTNGVVSTNWERNDDTNYSSIGTGLTESSGVFSFPQTGLYSINGTFTIFLNTGDAGGNVFFQYYINDVANDAALTSVDVASNYVMATSGFIFNVTDISTHKFRFITSSFSSGTFIYGNSNYNFSHFTAIRLGDSE